MKNKKIFYILLIVVILISLGGEFYLFRENQSNKKLIEGIEKTNLKLKSDLEHKELEIYNIQEKLYNKTENDNINEKISNNTDDSILKNTSTEGLSPISEKEAKEIMNKYKKDSLLDNLDYFSFVKAEKKEIESLYLVPKEDTFSSYNKYISQNKKRDVYAIYYSANDNLNKIIGYVDIYTGEILGIYQEGD